MKKKVINAQNEQQNERLEISLKTKRNGYLLEVGDEGYMYFDAQKMIEGFLVHVGLGRLEPMTSQEVKNLLKATLEGSAERMLQQEITALKEQVRNLKKEMKMKLKLCS